MFYYKASFTIFLFCSYFIRDSFIDKHKTIMLHPRAYYISPSGDDKNDGSRNAAFQSIQRVNILQLKPGDPILFRGGSQFAGSLILNYDSLGDKLHPIILSAYG